MNDFHEFLAHEKKVIHTNIERLENGLKKYTDDDPLAAGNQAMVAIQKGHIKLLDSLIEAGSDVQMTIATCQAAIDIEEEKHRKLLARGKSNTPEWWQTMDVIQFLGSLISRIQNFKQPA